MTFVVSGNVPEPLPPPPRWSLTLYVNGASPRSAEAILTVRQICDEDLVDVVDLRVVNAADSPDQIVRDNVLALPTLVKHTPLPLRQLIGDLTDVDRVRAALDLAPRADTGASTSSVEGGPTT